MTSLLDRPARSRAGGEPPIEARRLPAPARTRKPVLVAVSALLVFASIAIFASIESSSDHRTEVLVVTRTVQQGQLFAGSDLGSASLSVSSGVTPISVADASELAGRRAAVTLPAGSLLVPTDLATGPAVVRGDAIVGLALKAGQVPAAGVAPGDEVMVIETGIPGTPVSGALSAASSAGDASSDSAAGTTGVLVPEARVYDTASPSASSSSGDTELVSVEVPRAVSAAVSAAATAGQIGLVLLPTGGAGGSGSSGGSVGSSSAGSSSSSPGLTSGGSSS